MLSIKTKLISPTKIFIYNGLLLTAVSLSVRFISVAFNTYLSNKIGTAALGLFTLISSVYGFALTFATSGINLATTKLISEAMAKNDNGNRLCPSIMRRAFGYSLFFGGIATTVLFIFAEIIGTNILGDVRTISSLRILAFTLIPISISSALSGYFTAVRKIYRNAIYQIFNQFTKITSSIVILNLILTEDIESGCIALALSGLLTEGISFFLHFFFYCFERSQIRNYKSTQTVEAKKLYKIALPMAFSSYVRSILVTIEHILIPKGLERTGSDKESSLASYGTLHSLVFPFVLLPSAITSSFAGLLIPEVSYAAAKNDISKVKRITCRVFELVLLFSIFVSGIMLKYGQEIAKNLYPDAPNAGSYIIMIAPLIPIMYIDTSVDSILKGLGEQMYCMAVNIADATLSVILVALLIPKYGILGYIITVYFTEIINAAFSIARLLWVIHLRPRIIRWVVLPFFVLFISSKIADIFFMEYLNSNTILDLYPLLLKILFTGAFYIMVLSGCSIVKKIFRIDVPHFTNPAKNI